MWPFTRKKKDTAASTKAKATMHVKVLRADGRVEEFDVPVTTDLTKEQVRALIDAHQKAGACLKPARLEVERPNGGWYLLCDDHVAELRANAARNKYYPVNVRPAATGGLCAH